MSIDWMQAACSSMQGGVGGAAFGAASLVLAKIGYDSDISFVTAIAFSTLTGAFMMVAHNADEICPANPGPEAKL